MKIDLSPNHGIEYDSLTTKLQEKFPDYEFKMRGKQFLVCTKTKSCGANIVIRKKRLLINGNFPTMGGQMLFVLTILLLGFLIPLIIYFAVYHTKFKALEKEIGAFLQEEYANP